MIEFGRPWVLLGLPLLLAVGLAVPRPEVLVHPHARVPERDGPRLSGDIVFRLLTLLRGGVVLALVIALAEPTVVHTLPPDGREGRPVAVVLDVSASMATTDMEEGSRMRAARAALERLVSDRSGDRMALVTFGETARVRVPPTWHAEALLDALVAVNVDRNGDGTALGDGLAMGIDLLDRVAPGDGAVLLLTDGGHNTGSTPPVTAARAARALGVRVYTVGVGSRGGIGARGPDAGSLNGELLREVADLGGGRFFRAADPQALTAASRSVDSLEAVRMDGGGRRVVRRSAGAGFLALAFLGLVLEALGRGAFPGVVP